MRKPLEVSYHHVEKVPGLDALIQEQAEKLERYCDHMMHCHVVVERNGRGNLNDYRVRIDVRVPPHKDLVVTRHSENRDPKEALAPLVRDAFQTMQRRLTDTVERKQERA